MKTWLLWLLGRREEYVSVEAIARGVAQERAVAARREARADEELVKRIRERVAPGRPRVVRGRW